MQNTPDHIKKLQLQIWLAKTPEERLTQAVRDNEAMFAFWEQANRERKRIKSIAGFAFNDKNP